MTQSKKLIEVALPLDAINKASAREKSIRHGHPSTLHLWWARRPLAAARAVIFAQMVDDPSAYVDTLRSDPKLKRKAETALKARMKLWEEARELARKAEGTNLAVPEPGPQPTLDDMLADIERQRLFRIIEDLVLWENTTNETVLQAARDEIWASWRRACAENADHPRASELFDRKKLPAFHDPFAGGGALPLEAQRLGLESYASDLNPVAVLINKAMIEIPPKFAGKPPVNPAANARPTGPTQLSLTATHNQAVQNLGANLGAPASSRHKGWHSRGYLPHWDQPHLLQSITFRLADSLPQSVLTQWAADLRDHPDPDRERRRLIEAHLDRGAGDCVLADPRAAGIVEDALLHFDGERYHLLAWCIMPNHVHVLIQVLDGYPLDGVVHSWKSFTANEINRALGRSGVLWMREYHDRFIRDERHLASAIGYIEGNPVKAGLVTEARDWRFSSARGREEAKPPEPPGRRRSQGADSHDADAGPGIASREWKGAQGLAEDVRYYGQWMRDEAEKRIGHLYPKVEVTAEMAKARLDLKPYIGRQLTVIAWLWARTVKSPNPAFRDVDVPLASTFMLSTKEGKEAYVEPVIEPGSAGFQPATGRQDAIVPSYRFTVKVGKPKDAEAAKNGTKLSRGANFECLMSGTPIAGDYIKAEGRAGRMGARLMAIVAEGDRGRVYLAPTPEHEATARRAKPEWEPEGALPDDPRNFWTVQYGLTTFGDLFTPRQLVALTTFSDLVQEARERVQRDALDAGLTDDGEPLRDGGTGAKAYADTVGVYLAFCVDKATLTNTTGATWQKDPDRLTQGFGRQAIPMVWDYAEANPLSEAGGGFGITSHAVGKVLERLPLSPIVGAALQRDAAASQLSVDRVVSCDPPYYDNIGYADLSDYFYVWLRRSLRPVFPDLFDTLAVPKAEELVATPYRHGSKEKAETFFLDGMTQAMRRLAEQAHPAFPVTIYYAFKQSESDTDDGTTNTGWDTFLAAVIEAGFAVSGTWPMRTELTANLKKGISALASSIILVCRPRTADAPTATRREFVTTLKAELPVALAHLQRGNIAPVDLAQAAIGPGMAVYTRYAEVLDAEGKPLTVREALALINQTLDEALAEQEGDFDADSRWALTWFEQSGFAEGEYGVAETLSKAKNTSVAGMVEAGFLESRRGKVRLLRPEELPADWDPATDPRLSAWEIVHHLIRVLASGGEGAAAELVGKLGAKAEIARELAYRLYTLCEHKKRAQDALSYNGLVQSWPEIARLAREERGPAAEQGVMFGEP